MEPWFSQSKSTVGELPEATNESLCEAIMPPVAEMSSKVEFGRRSGGLCPCGPHPSFEASTVALSVARLLDG
jgi:hypothetical protein